MEQITVQQEATQEQETKPVNSTPPVDSGSEEDHKEGQPTPEELEREMRTRALLEDKYDLDEMEDEEGDSEIQKVLAMISQSRPVVIIPPEHDLSLIDQKPDFIYMEDATIESRLREWADQGVEALQEGNFIQAAKDLSQAEQLVNAIHYSFKSVPPAFRTHSVQVMLNLAILYYRVGFLEESYAAFLNTNQMLGQSISLLHKDKPLSIGQTMAVLLQEQQFLKITNQIDLQICILLSELGKNPEALEFARKAAEGNYYVFLSSVFQLLYVFYKQYPPVQNNLNYKNIKRPATKQGYGTSQFIVRKGNVRQGVQQQEDNKNRNGSAKRGLSNSSQQGNPLLLNSQKIETKPDVPSKLSQEDEYKMKVLNFMMSIYGATRKEITTLSLGKGPYSTLITDLHTQIDSMATHLSSLPLAIYACPSQNTLFDPLSADDPLYESTILSVLQMKPQKTLFVSDEHYSFNYLQDVIMMALSYYCNSTELRFIEEKQKLLDPDNPLPKRICESELMLGVSMLVVYQYLKHEIPLVGQIVSVYNRAYGLAQQMVYEEDEYEYSYTYLRLIPGAPKVTGFAPILRFIKSQEALRESMLDSLVMATKPLQGTLRVDRTGKDRAKEIKAKPTVKQELQERREKRLQRNFNLKENKQKEPLASQQLVLQTGMKKSDSKKEMEYREPAKETRSANVSVSSSSGQVNVRNLTFGAKRVPAKGITISSKPALGKKVVSSNVQQLNKIYQTKEKKKKGGEPGMDIQINNYINIFFNNERTQGNNNELNKLILPNVMRNNKMKGGKTN